MLRQEEKDILTEGLPIFKKTEKGIKTVGTTEEGLPILKKKDVGEPTLLEQLKGAPLPGGAVPSISPIPPEKIPARVPEEKFPIPVIPEPDITTTFSPEVKEYYSKKTDVPEKRRQIDAAKYQIQINDINTAISQNPTDPNNYLKLGKLHTDMGSNDLALKSYSQVIKSNPDAPQGYWGAAQVYLNKGEDDNALILYNDAMKRGADTPSMRNNIAFIKAKKGDYAGAIEDMTTAISDAFQKEMSPTIFYFNRAIINDQAGNKESAAKDFAYGRYYSLKNEHVRIAPPGEQAVVDAMMGKGVFAIINPLGAIISAAGTGIGEGLRKFTEIPEVAKEEGKISAGMVGLAGTANILLGAVTPFVPVLRAFVIGTSPLEDIPYGEYVNKALAPFSTIAQEGYKLAGKPVPKGVAATGELFDLIAFMWVAKKVDPKVKELGRKILRKESLTSDDMKLFETALKDLKEEDVMNAANMSAMFPKHLRNDQVLRTTELLNEKNTLLDENTKIDKEAYKTKIDENNTRIGEINKELDSISREPKIEPYPEGEEITPPAFEIEPEAFRSYKIDRYIERHKEIRPEIETIDKEALKTDFIKWAEENKKPVSYSTFKGYLLSHDISKLKPVEPMPEKPAVIPTPEVTAKPITPPAAEPEITIGKKRFRIKEEAKAKPSKELTAADYEYFNEGKDAWIEPGKIGKAELEKYLTEKKVPPTLTEEPAKKAKPPKEEVKPLAEAQPTEAPPPTPEKPPVVRKIAYKAPKERTEIQKLLDKEATTLEESILQFFVAGGRIKTDDYIKHTGFGMVDPLTKKRRGMSDFRRQIWAHKKDGVPMDVLYERIDLPEHIIEKLEFSDIINATLDALGSYKGKSGMIERLKEFQKEEIVPKEIEKYISDEEMINEIPMELIDEVKESYDENIFDIELSDYEKGIFEKMLNKQMDEQGNINWIKLYETLEKDAKDLLPDIPDRVKEKILSLLYEREKQEIVTPSPRIAAEKVPTKEERIVQSTPIEEAKPTVPEKLRATAEDIRKFKIDNDLTMATVPFAKEIWNGAIEVAAKTLEAGADMTEAISKAIEYIKGTDWYRGLIDTDKKAAEDKITEHFKQFEEKPLKLTMPEARRLRELEGLTEERMTSKTIGEVASETIEFIHKNPDDQLVKDTSQRIFRRIGAKLTMGELLPEQVKSGLDKYGLSVGDFSLEFMRAASEAGKSLAMLSRVAKDILKLAPDTPETKAAREKLKQLEKEMSWSDLMWSKFMNGTRSLLDIWRGLLVTQLKTAMRNAASQSGRAIQEVFTDVVTGGIEYGKGDKPFLQAMAPAMEDLAAAYRRLVPSERRKLNDLLSKYAETTSDLYNIPIQEGITPSRIVNWLNTFNRFQETQFRKWAFDARITTSMKEKGVTEPTDAMLTDAVSHSLNMTFADPKAPISKALIRTFNDNPWLLLMYPFPRFFGNVVRHVYKYSPAGFMDLVSPDFRMRLAGKKRVKIKDKETGEERIELKDTDPREAYKDLAKAGIGTTMVAMGMAIRNSDNAGEKWYEVNVGGKTIDTRFLAPIITPYLFMGDLIVNYEKYNERNVQSIMEGLFGMRPAAGTTRMMVEIITGQQKIEGIGKTMKNFVGEFLGGFAVPFSQVKDLMATFEPEERIVREKKVAPLLGPATARIPFLSRTLPPKISITRGEPMKSDYPIPFFIGLNVKDKTYLESEIDKLGIDYWELMPKIQTKDTELTDEDAVNLVNKIAEQMGKGVIPPTSEHPAMNIREWGESLKDNEAYQKMSDEKKKNHIKLWLSRFKKGAKTIIFSQFPELARKARIQPEEE